MSLRLSRDEVLEFQRLRRAEGLYAGRLDGRWGPVTEAAARAFDAGAAALRERHGVLDARSESQLAGLLLPAQAAARVFMSGLDRPGTRTRVISGHRSYAEQDALFRRGRYGNPGPVVTRARGGQSAHNFGIAWDIGLFDAKGGYVTTAKPYADAAMHADAAVLDWGGDDRGFVDPSHFQLRLGFGLDEVRRRFEAGIAFVEAMRA